MQVSLDNIYLINNLLEKKSVSKLRANIPKSPSSIGLKNNLNSENNEMINLNEEINNVKRSDSEDGGNKPDNGKVIYYLI